MKALDLISTSLNSPNDEPNQKLAKEIIASKNYEWVKELAENLSNEDKNIQSDCIKVLYEIGERGAPELIAAHWKAFIDILYSKNNRLVWGAMTAIDKIALLKPSEIFKNLELIEKIIEKGSVITIDHGISILAKLASFKEYQNQVIPKLINQLEKCPAKQFPMYIEKSVIAMNKSTKEDFIGIIEIRYKDLEKDSQKKRVEKIRKKILSL